MSIVQIPNFAIVKLEPNFDNDVCVDIDLLDTSPFLLKSGNSTPSTLSLDLPQSPYNLMYVRLSCQVAPFQHPSLHHYPSSTCLNIVEALKSTKSRKRSKFDFASIDFDNIEV